MILHLDYLVHAIDCLLYIILLKISLFLIPQLETCFVRSLVFFGFGYDLVNDEGPPMLQLLYGTTIFILIQSNHWMIQSLI